MSSSRRRPQQAELFDLELGGAAVSEPAAADGPAPAELDLPAEDAGPPGPSEWDAEPAGWAEMTAAVPVAPRQLTAPQAPAPATVRARLMAAAIDLGCHGVAAAAATGGAAVLGVPPEVQALPGLVLLVVVFSLFFLVVPLAFWGRTAGMAAVGIVCRVADDQPPTFGEATRRWLGSLLTVAGLGLPALPVLAGGRSLADRLSGSVVVAG